MTALTLTWSNEHPLDGSIWRALWQFKGTLGSSWIVSELPSNLLESAGIGRGDAALFVVAAAAAAFVLALPLTLRKAAT